MEVTLLLLFYCFHVSGLSTNHSPSYMEAGSIRFHYGALRSCNSTNDRLVGDLEDLALTVVSVRFMLGAAKWGVLFPYTVSDYWCFVTLIQYRM